VEYSSAGVVYGTTVNSRGQFSFKAYEGVTISVRAVLEANGKHVYSDWGKVDAATKLKLVLPDSPE
jgi:hypothetical protein